MPMAGEGLRLKGYSDIPKPLIKVNDYNMFLWSLQGIPVQNNFIFIVKNEHVIDYKIDETIHEFYPGAKIIIQDGKLNGAVMSTLLAEDIINNDEPLLILDCDIFVKTDYNSLLYNTKSDAAVVVSHNTASNYSYVKINNDVVTEIAEKNVISDNAICGVYFWKKGKDYVHYAKRLIEKNITTNGEFYVAPVLNEAIQDNKKVTAIKAEKFYHLGTKEDISLFMDGHNE